MSAAYSLGATYVRKWGWRGASFTSLICLCVAALYYFKFLGTASQNLSVDYHCQPVETAASLWEYCRPVPDVASLYVDYAALWLLIALWLRYFSARLVLVTTMAFALLVLNVAFLWTSTKLGSLLALIPGWIPQVLVDKYLVSIQFPYPQYTQLDHYYLAWFGGLSVLSIIFFRSRLSSTLIHTIEFLCLVLVPLPVEVFLFDRHEFTNRVMVAQVRTPFSWFTNQDLLVTLLAVFLVLALTDGILFKGGVLGGLGRRTHWQTSERRCLEGI